MKRKFFLDLFIENTKRQTYMSYKTAVYGYIPKIIGEFFWQ